MQVHAPAVVCMDAQAQVLVHVVRINVSLHGDGLELFKVRGHLEGAGPITAQVVCQLEPPVKWRENDRQRQKIKSSRLHRKSQHQQRKCCEAITLKYLHCYTITSFEQCNTNSVNLTTQAIILT